MIFLAIQQRRWLFGLTLLIVVLLAGGFAMLRAQSYTASAEVVFDPTLLAGDSEKALDKAEAWLRSPDAARSVARAMGTPATTSLMTPDGAWSTVVEGLTREITPPPDSPEAKAMLVRRIMARLSVDRIPQSYALDIRFSDSDPRLAAALANAFAERIVARSRGGDPLGAGMRVISAADAGTPEDGPAAWLVLAGGAFAGIIIGAAAVAIVERRFNGLTSGADIQSRLNLYHLGSVPLLHSVLPDAASPLDAVVEAPLSGFAEAYRSVLVAIRQAAGADAKVFAITSALPGEGKSTIVTCLARSAALAGETVVVVDCDSRRSGASAALAGDRRGPGIFNLLRGGCSLDEVLVRDDRSGAWILPCPQNEKEAPLLLSSDTMRKLLATLRTRFDRVLIDTAPVLAMASTQSLMPLADAAIMVVRWRATPDHAVKAALAMTDAQDTPWAGVILTQVDIRKQARYGHGDASAYYQQSSKYYR